MAFTSFCSMQFGSPNVKKKNLLTKTCKLAVLKILLYLSFSFFFKLRNGKEASNSLICY